MSASKMYHTFLILTLYLLNQTISIVTEKIPTFQKPIGYQNLWWKNNDLKRALNNRINSRQIFNLICLFCGFLYIFRCASNISLTGKIPKYHQFIHFLIAHWNPVMQSRSIFHQLHFLLLKNIQHLKFKILTIPISSIINYWKNSLKFD
jgi:hypothetical protein